MTVEDAAGAFPFGARIEVVLAGAGQITVRGAGITLRLPSSKQAKIVLTQRTYDEWFLSSDLAYGDAMFTGMISMTPEHQEAQDRASPI